MNVTVIDNHDSFVYNLVRYIGEYLSAPVEVMRNNSINWNILDQTDAIVLSPGPGIPSTSGEMMQVIDRYHTSKPILGVCLGHQALGEYFGGQLVTASQLYHGKQDIVNLFNHQHIFKNLPEAIRVGRYHSWVLSKDNLSKCLEITATTPNNEIMAIAHKSLPLYGVQFHPESILTPQGRTIINNFLKLKSCKS